MNGFLSRFTEQLFYNYKRIGGLLVNLKVINWFISALNLFLVIIARRLSEIVSFNVFERYKSSLDAL